MAMLIQDPHSLHTTMQSSNIRYFPLQNLGHLVHRSGLCGTVFIRARFDDVVAHCLLRMCCEGSKKYDPTATGKFGLGFNSTYHLTECPMFISGDWFVVLDPQKR